MKIIDIRKYYVTVLSDQDRLPDDHQSRSPASANDGEYAGRGLVSDAWARTVGRVPSDKVDGAPKGQWGVLLSWPVRKISDDLIYSRILFSLFADPQVDDTHIRVRVVNGLVTLNGAVTERCHKDRAEDLATNENGVTMVRNLLTVSPEGATSGRPC